MTRNIKATKRIVTWVLLIMLFMGAIALQPVVGTVLAIYEEQEAWQSILDADLQPDKPVYGDDNTLGYPHPKQTKQRTDFTETGSARKAKYDTFLLDETEAYATDRYIIKYTGSNPATELISPTVQAAIGIDNIETIGESETGSDSFAVVSLEEPTSFSEFRQTIMARQSGSEIEYIQPDYTMEMSADDKAILAFGNSGGLSADASGNSIIVAVLDTGIDITHPDLVGKIYINTAEIDGNGYDDDCNGYIDDISGWDFFNNDNSVNDAGTYTDQWHGTHVTGIITAQAPEAKILPIKVFEGGYAYTSDIISAIAYCESIGAKVINCSWGSRYENKALREAMEGSGSLFVCSAGNNLYNMDNYPVYPAAFSTELGNVISVASVDYSYKLARFSNYGAGTVDITAPGADIRSTWLDGSYRNISGTSMSAGFVSATAALIYAQNNAFDASDIKSRIISSADTVTGLKDKIINGKMLNTIYALSNAATPNTNVIDAPDDDPLPVIIPNTPTEEEENELFGAENHVTYKASMQTARHGLQVVELGGKIYAIGGQTTASGGFSKVVECYDPTADTWASVASMNTARAYFGAVVYNGKIYVMGGAISSSGNTNSIESYDQGTDKWTQLSVTLPIAMRNFSATIKPGTSSVYIVGGYTTNANSQLSTVYEYNITAAGTGTVTAKTTLSAPVSNHIAFYRNNIIYIKGGRTPKLGHGYRYDISSDTPSDELNSYFYEPDAAMAQVKDRVLCIGGGDGLACQANITNIFFSGNGDDGHYGRTNHLITARSGMGAAVLDGKVYIVGGRYSNTPLSTLEVLDLGWEEKASPPLPVSNYKSVSLNGKLYIMGGQKRENGIMQNSNAVYEYNSMDNSWRVMPTAMPVYARSFSLTAAYGKIYLFGGQTSPTMNGSFTTSNKIYEYNPQTEVWTEKNTLESARYDLSSVLYEGKIYITGGRTSSRGMTTVETYDPLTNVREAKPPLAQAVYSHFSCVLNNELYIFASYSQYYQKYNKATGTWSTFTCGSDMPFGMFVVLNGSLYSLGYSGDNYTSLVFYMFSVIDNAWYSYLAFNYYGHLISVTELNNKAYIMTSGSSSSVADGLVNYTPPATAWVYTGFISENLVGIRAATLNNEVYATGGRSYGAGGLICFNVLHKYQADSEGWVTLKGMKYAREHLGFAAANGKLYAIGGQNASSVLSHVEEYDPNLDNWTDKAPNSSPTVTDMAIASYKGMIYIFGGRTTTAGSGITTVRRYDPSSNQWSNMSSMSTARFGCSAAVINDKIYVVGGFTSGTTATTAVEVYNPDSNTWDKEKPQLPAALGWAGVVASDSLYVIGGYNGTSTNSMVYEYSPVTKEWYIWAGPNGPRYDFGAAITDSGIFAIAGYANAVISDTEFAVLNNLRNDYRHLGDDRINLTGNFSRTYTDLSYTSQGFNIEFTRTYNSSDTRPSLISPGWTFGFQGKVESSGNDIVVRLPNGSGCTFKKNPNGSFTALDSRSTLVKHSNNTYTLTTKDQYTYGFNTDGYMNWMKDRNGNTVTIAVNATGQVTAVTDQAGRATSIAYSSNRISTITDPAGRVVAYAYDAAGRLSSVKDPNGYFTYYTYHTSGDATGLLSTVKDHSNSNVLESITYLPKQGDRLPRVGTTTDSMNNTRTYAYNDSDGKLTATDSNNRVNITWYDKTVYPIRERDAEGKDTLTGYNLTGGLNRYGEVSYHTDRNGNTVYYDRDALGNITRQINPDGSVREYTYDGKDNLLSEKDELGKYTFYVYDANSINLVKTAQPLNGTDIYSTSAPQSNFAITSYSYYTVTEAQSQTGKQINGLLKSVADPEGGITTYTYEEMFIKGSHFIAANHALIGASDSAILPFSLTDITSTP